MGACNSEHLQVHALQLMGVSLLPFATTTSPGRAKPNGVWQMKAIERDSEYEDPMTNISYPDDDRLSFWGVPYQFDCVFGPGTEQAKV